MSDERADVARMLENYRNLIQRFASGEMSADVFETEYLALFKNDPHQVIGAEFDALSRDRYGGASLDHVVEVPVLGVPQNLPLVARSQRVDHSE